MSDIVSCWSWCVSTVNCVWFSYETTGIQICRLFENCPKIDEEQYPQFTSGHKNCLYTYSKFIQIFLDHHKIHGGFYIVEELYLQTFYSNPIKLPLSEYKL